MIKDIKKYNFKTGLPHEFEIVELSELYNTSKNMITHLHRAGFYHIIWFQDCKVSHFVDFKLIHIKPNSLLFIKKDVVHRFDDKETVKGKVILFTDRFFCKTESDTKFLRQSILFNDFFEVTQIDIERQASTFDHLVQLMTNEIHTSYDEYQAHIVQKLLHSFLLLSERERRKQKVTELRKGADLDYVTLFNDLLEVEFKSKKQVSYYANKMSTTDKRN